MKKATNILPYVGKELLKKRHQLQRTARPGFVMVSDADEAYYYWEHWGKFWVEDPEILEWLIKN